MIKADDSPYIKWPLPAIDKEEVVVYPLFEDDVFQRIKKRFLEIGFGPGSEHFYHTTPGRWEGSIAFDNDINEIVLKRAREIFNEPDLVHTYDYCVRYQKQGVGVPHLWRHMDQNGCQYTIDVCIEKKDLDWGITIDGKTYDEKENQAVAFFGQQQDHSRPKYPTDNEDSYISLVFFHFVKPGHWLITEGSSKFPEYGLDGDIRFYEQHGFVSEPETPVENRCPCHDYTGTAQALRSIGLLKDGN